MTEAELDALAKDIVERGQVLPIVTAGGLILDGRNRWLACDRAGIKPWLEEIETDDPDALAWSLNEHRRHAGEGVRSIAARKRANMRQGERTDLPSANLLKVSQTEAAKLFGVSPRSVAHAGTVLDHNDPMITEAVERDELAVSLAAKAVRRIEETGEGFTSIAELKKTMREVYREENPAAPPRSAPAHEPRPAIDHVPLDTFGVINALVRHAAANPAPDVANALDKWTRLAILDDVPRALAYLGELEKILAGEADK